MTAKKNILFIMCDQLRQDYLSCYGHKTLRTPNIDRLADRGVRFDQAHCQAPLCAPSRASFYTGRYQSSHGVMGNDDVTQLGEKMLADYLRPLGYRTAVVGKTHSRKSAEDIRQAGIDPNSHLAQTAETGGFEPYEWHEGLFPDPILPLEQGYTNYLRKVGYQESNPWDQRANSSVDETGTLQSGWSLRSARYPAAIAEEHSETAFTTRRAIDFMSETVEQPWCLHLSYIKPHWPIIAPAPYHNMYRAEDIQPVMRRNSSPTNSHPVVEAFKQTEYSQSYSDREIREIVIPAYMGLVTQVDDHLGKLFEFMTSAGMLEHTLIIFTSDHGDYLGDHDLGEKDLFHKPSVKIPMIVVDPRPQANCTRGLVRHELVESVDVVPTFIEFAGGETCQERMEGRSLLPLLESKTKPPSWRGFTISEIDYAERGIKEILNIDRLACRAVMIANHDWKYIYYHGFPPQLFDLKSDPDELYDLGQDPNMESIRQNMKQALFEWKFSLKNRVGLDYHVMEGQGPIRDEEYGIIIGRK
ncbi:MAG: sulfatase-like hydrolase/transferase [Acidiferrobacterales bacterium]|nr:sulfatase-like hydrolase/transferase [Acidiferrobacterales bacterium]